MFGLVGCPPFFSVFCYPTGQFSLIGSRGSCPAVDGTEKGAIIITGRGEGCMRPDDGITMAGLLLCSLGLACRLLDVLGMSLPIVVERTKQRQRDRTVTE